MRGIQPNALGESMALHTRPTQHTVLPLPDHQQTDPDAYHQEYNSLQELHMEGREAVINGTREKLDALSRILVNIEVTQENEKQVEDRVRSILDMYADNGEAVRDIFDL